MYIPMEHVATCAYYPIDARASTLPNLSRKESCMEFGEKKYFLPKCEIKSFMQKHMIHVSLSKNPQPKKGNNTLNMVCQNICAMQSQHRNIDMDGDNLSTKA